MKSLLFGLIFIGICAFIGYHLSEVFDEGILDSASRNALVGAGIGIFIILLKVTAQKITIRTVSAIFFGIFLGLVITRLVIGFLAMFMSYLDYWNIVKISTTLLFSYLGILIAVKAKDEFNLTIPYIKLMKEGRGEQIILVDTSVIIDGRISDIINTGFIEGKFIIPRFILKELQQVADSKDSLKRNRGRRGLDVLNKIKSDSKIKVSIQDQDFPDIKEVDAKLVKLAKITGARILTNDYNLNKVAELQGVEVLNINELANALKPVVLPGEHMYIKLTKKGKENTQAIAYLDDGTMIVVDDSRHLIGKKINVEVTSVLQTSAGRMIFASPAKNK